MTPGPGIEHGTHWWEASALATAEAEIIIYSSNQGKKTKWWKIDVEQITK